MQQQSQLRQQQLISAGPSPIAQQQQPQQATQRELVPGTGPASMQAPQQLQTTGASGTWIPQQAENAGTGRLAETSEDIHFRNFLKLKLFLILILYSE